MSYHNVRDTSFISKSSTHASGLDSKKIIPKIMTPHKTSLKKSNKNKQQQIERERLEGLQVPRGLHGRRRKKRFRSRVATVQKGGKYEMQ